MPLKIYRFIARLLVAQYPTSLWNQVMKRTHMGESQSNVNVLYFIVEC